MNWEPDNLRLIKSMDVQLKQNRMFKFVYPERKG